MELKLRYGVAAVGVLFGLGLIAADASNGALFDPANGGLGIAGVATAGTFGFLVVK